MANSLPATREDRGYGLDGTMTHDLICQQVLGAIAGYALFDNARRAPAECIRPMRIIHFGYDLYSMYILDTGNRIC